MSHHSCCGTGGGGPCEPWPVSFVPVPYYYAVPTCPACGQPLSQCACSTQTTLTLPQEITLPDGTTTTAQAVVGGGAEVTLVLEMLAPDGSPTPPPEVTLELAGSPSTTLFHQAGIPAGYQVKDDLPAASPGDQLKLTVINCFARLRWCEQVSY